MYLYIPMLGIEIGEMEEDERLDETVEIDEFDPRDMAEERSYDDDDFSDLDEQEDEDL